MSDRTDNVFPQLVQDGYELSQIFGGLTKREYFAAIAMQGLLASDTIPDESRWTFEGCAATALDHADALIAALNREIPD